MTEKLNKRYTKSFIQKFKASPQDIFSYICETKEPSLYSYGKSELVYSMSGLAEDNCIFNTHLSNKDDVPLWVITSFDPEKEIQFVQDNADTLNLITVKLFGNDQAESSIEIRFSVTILGDFNEEKFNKIKDETDTEIERIKNFIKSKFEELA